MIADNGKVIWVLADMGEFEFVLYEGNLPSSADCQMVSTEKQLRCCVFYA